MGDNIVLSDDPKVHEQYDSSDREVVVFTPTPVSFELVTVQVIVLEHQNSNKGIPESGAGTRSHGGVPLLRPAQRRGLQSPAPASLHLPERPQGLPHQHRYLLPTATG
jgi:hypothetical protein